MHIYIRFHSNHHVANELIYCILSFLEFKGQLGLSLTWKIAIVMHCYLLVATTTRSSRDNLLGFGILRTQITQGGRNRKINIIIFLSLSDCVSLFVPTFTHAPHPFIPFFSFFLFHAFGCSCFFLLLEQTFINQYIFMPYFPLCSG